MHLRAVKPTAFSIAGAVILAVSVLALLRPDFLERFERISYDQRVRLAAYFSPPIATNLGFVFISDQSITAVNGGSLGYRHGLYWPRHVYGRLLRELSNQGAKAVAFDVVFSDLRPDHAAVSLHTNQANDFPGFLGRLHPAATPTTYAAAGELRLLVESDEFFAWQLSRSARAIMAAERQVPPHSLFATNALAVGDISADADKDGVLRRVRAFQTYLRWHPAFLRAEAEGYFDLRRAHIQPGVVVIPRDGAPDLRIELDAQDQFDLADFFGGASRRERAFERERVWHMGVQLTAQSLALDLNRAEVDLVAGEIRLFGSNGVQRTLPVDADGFLLINWEITVDNPLLLTEPIESLLAQDRDRAVASANAFTNRWQDRLVVVGSAALGNDLTDHGATPLEKDTLLASKHWNVANSIITGRFIVRSSSWFDVLLIAVLGGLTAWLTWRLRGFAASAAVLGLALTYVVVVFGLFIQSRHWLPIFLPITGALFVQYGLLVTYRVVFEEQERRRTKSIFSKLVAPEIVSELLAAKNLPLGGARRVVTVLFADVRGFTELTDQAQERAEQTVRAQNLTGAAAAACHDETARATLETVNLYLATVSGLVKKHRGVLDKYIGDCVMAFWGAPEANPRHATACVRMAIEAQRAIFALNQQRQTQNQSLEVENHARASAGLPLKSPLPLLMLGTGINTGSVTVGLMGSDEHGLNYTVFGREVNLASRLESISGRGRIVIGENTLQELQRDDPGLAARCVELEAVAPKGFQKPVRIFAVPWQDNSSAD